MKVTRVFGTKISPSQYIFQGTIEEFRKAKSQHFLEATISER